MFEPKRLSVDTPMGGQQAPDATGGAEGNMPASDEAYRAECYGEALTACSKYLRDDIVSPPSQDVFQMLGIAYGRISKEIDAFTPQDFALYAMSILPRHIEGVEDADPDLRRGAMQYLLDVKPKLSPAFQNLAEEARRFLEEPELGSKDRAPTGEPLGPFERAFAIEDDARPRQRAEPADYERQATANLTVAHVGAPYRRLDLATPKRNRLTAIEQPRHTFERGGVSKGHNDEKARYAAIGLILVTALTGTALATYIAVSLLFAT